LLLTRPIHLCPTSTSARLVCSTITTSTTASMHALRSSCAPSSGVAGRSRAAPAAAAAARARPAAPARSALSPPSSANDGDAPFKIPEGASVRVTKAVRIYHAPKCPAEGLDLQGMRGTVAKHAAVHKDGRVLSVNLPYKVAFELPPAADGGKPVKFQAHLEESEIEVV
jgi:hypothetical protein